MSVRVRTVVVFPVPPFWERTVIVVPTRRVYESPRGARSLGRAFIDQGITFSLSGQERPFPLDLVPRVISAAEWSRLEKGITQRVKALELYLDDVAQQLPRLVAALRRGETGSVAVSAHRLKSASFAVGALRVAAIAAELRVSEQSVRR